MTERFRQIKELFDFLKPSDLTTIREKVRRGANTYQLHLLLHSAVHAGDLRSVLYLLKHGADASLKGVRNDTLLHRASSRDTPESYYIHMLLILEGVGVNDRNREGITPLLMALQSGSLDCIKLLLYCGADKSAVCGTGKTALHYAARNPNVNVMKLLEDQHGFDIFDCASTYGDFSVLCEAARCGNLPVCEYLLKRGVPVNKRCKATGQIPITVAVIPDVEGRVVELLLEYGANMYDDEIISVFGLAFGRSGNERVLYVLIRHMAKLEYLDGFISDSDRQIVENERKLWDYYRSCSTELEKMKEARFYNSVSLLSILLGSDKVISGYVRNKELIEALWKENCNKKFPIYSASLKRKFDSAVEKQQMRYSAAISLGDLLGLNDPSHPITQKILDYLEDGDSMCFIGK